MASPSNANMKVKPSEIKLTEKYRTASDPMSPTHPLHRGVPVNYLKPVQLSFEWMLYALRFVARNVIHCRWNKGMTQSYLKSCAIPDRVTNKMYDSFNNMDVSEDIDGGAV